MDEKQNIVELQKFTFSDDLVLDSGQKIGPMTIAYETYGQLNKDKSNADRKSVV